jgi:hypothetical protein
VWVLGEIPSTMSDCSDKKGSNGLLFDWMITNKWKAISKNLVLVKPKLQTDAKNDRSKDIPHSCDF